jgi:hypothetical protein
MEALPRLPSISITVYKAADIIVPAIHVSLPSLRRSPRREVACRDRNSWIIRVPGVGRTAMRPIRRPFEVDMTRTETSRRADF